jgi:hypothetical protein
MKPKFQGPPKAKPKQESSDRVGTFEELMALDPKNVKKVEVLPSHDMGHKIRTRKIQ